MDHRQSERRQPLGAARRVYAGTGPQRPAARAARFQPAPTRPLLDAPSARHALRAPGNAMPPAIIPISATMRTMACRTGRRRTGASKTPIWSSGTRSGIIIFPRPEDWPRYALRVDWVQIKAEWLFRPQSRARCTALAGKMPPERWRKGIVLMETRNVSTGGFYDACAASLPAGGAGCIIRRSSPFRRNDGARDRRTAQPDAGAARSGNRGGLVVAVRAGASRICSIR